MTFDSSLGKSAEQAKRYMATWKVKASSLPELVPLKTSGFRGLTRLLDEEPSGSLSSLLARSSNDFANDCEASGLSGSWIGNGSRGSWVETRASGSSSSGTGEGGFLGGEPGVEVPHSEGCMDRDRNVSPIAAREME